MLLTLLIADTNDGRTLFLKDSFFDSVATKFSKLTSIYQANEKFKRNKAIGLAF